MLSKEYLETARTILRAAQTMTDQHVAGQLKALAEDYERRGEKAARADAAKALARPAAREAREVALSSTSSSRGLTACGSSIAGASAYGMPSRSGRAGAWGVGRTPGGCTGP